MRITALVLTLFIAASGFAETDLSTVVPENTTVVIRVDWKQLNSSILATEIIDSNFEQFNNLTEGIRNATGIKLDDVARVWLFAEKENSGAILLEGAVDVDAILAQVGKSPDLQLHDKEGFDLYAEYVERDQKKILAARKNLALAGNHDFMIGLLKTMAGENEAVAENASLTALAEDDATIAVALLSMNDEIRKKNPDVASLISHANMGVTVTDVLSAKLNLETLAPEQAEGLQMMAQGMIALQSAKIQQMAANSDQFPAGKIREATILSELMKTMKITRKTTTVSADWTLSKEGHELIKSLMADKNPGIGKIAVP